MPNPKRKHSKQRRDKRRTHDKAVVPTLATCQNCGSAILYHRVCPECGYYKGKPAIKKEAVA
jgi:large subunit ribosomal protein L32